MIRSTGPIRRRPSVVSPSTTIPLLSSMERNRGESRHKRHAPAVDKRPNVRAEFAARRQLVGIPAAINSCEIDASRRPQKRSARLSFRELGEFEQRVGGRVARPYDERLSTRVEMTIAAKNIRNAVGDPIGELGFAHGRQAARPERIRRRPRARGVDNRARQITANAFLRCHRQDKGPRLSPVADDFVDALPRDRGNAGVGFNDGRQLRRCRKRFEIGADQLGPCRTMVGRRQSPTVTIEERRRSLVDAVAPRREDADMTPVADVRADRQAGLIDLHRQAASDEMRGGGQTDRAAADHGNRERFAKLACPYSILPGL